MTALTGTFACPICGEDSPHHHTDAEQKAYRARFPGWDWGVQIGLVNGDPVLLHDASGQVTRFASQKAAEMRCAELNVGPPSLRPSAIPCDLNALADEQLDDAFDSPDSGAEHGK